MRNASCYCAKPVLPTANGQSSDVLPADEIGSGSDQTLFRNGHVESLPAGVDPGPPSGNEDEGLKEEALRRERLRLEESRRRRQADRKTCQTFVQSQFQDNLLLAIRNLEWHPLWQVPRAAADAIPADIAKLRFSLSGADRKRFSSDPVIGGRQMLLQDALALLKRLRLVELRESEDTGQEVRATPRKDPRFTIDPEFESLLPRCPVEVSELEARLLAEGCRDALVVWKGHGVLIDGHSRFKLLALLGRPYKVDELDLRDRQAVKDWMWNEHYSRRNYTIEAKSYARGRQLLALQRDHGGDRRSQDFKSNRLDLKTGIAALIARYRVERATLYQDAKFAAALDHLVELCDDRVRQAVLAQTVPLTKRDVLRLARLTPEKQQHIVQEVLNTGNRPQWPKKDQVGNVHLRLPRGQRQAQAKVAIKKLGPAEAWRFAKTIIACLRPRRKSAQQQTTKKTEGALLSGAYVDSC